MASADAHSLARTTLFPTVVCGNGGLLQEAGPCVCFCARGARAAHLLGHGEEVIQHLHPVPVYALLLKGPAQPQEALRVGAAPQARLPGPPLLPPALSPGWRREPLLQVSVDPNDLLSNLLAGQLKISELVGGVSLASPLSLYKLPRYLERKLIL